MRRARVTSDPDRRERRARVRWGHVWLPLGLLLAFNRSPCVIAVERPPEASAAPESTHASAASESTHASAAPESTHSSAARREGRDAAATGEARVPKLAVIIAVDGLAWNTLSANREFFQDGLKRILDEGSVAERCRYLHINTLTGPGHASLSTGAPPSRSGIPANTWYERGLVDRKGRPCKLSAARTWNGGDTRPNDCETGNDPEDRKSWMLGPGNLRRDTLGDLLSKRTPGARVVSLSGKSPAAILLAGRGDHIVYWFKDDAGTFTTSEYYKRAPADGERVVQSFNLARCGTTLLDRFGPLWRRGPDLAQLPARRPDLDLRRFAEAHPYQISSLGIGFDHDLTKHPKGYNSGIFESPMIDELLADLALVFLNDEGLALGRRSATDLLCISFSAQDTVSHSYGCESEENLDTLLRLDRQIGRLLSAFDRSYPKGSVALALSADHGFAPIPELATKRSKQLVGARLLESGNTPMVGGFSDRLNAALNEELCLEKGSKPVHDVDVWNLFYSEPSRLKVDKSRECGAGRAAAPTVRELDEAVPRMIERLYGPEIKSVVVNSALRCGSAARTDDADDMTYVCNDFDPERSGDLILIPRPNVMMHWDPGRGSTHGSHHDYDTRVPLIFWGGCVKPGAFSGPATPYDLAPTLAGMVGVEFPPTAPARKLPLPGCGGR